jgi:hypothetical protein
MTIRDRQISGQLTYPTTKVKAKFTLGQATMTNRYSSTLSLTSALDGEGGQRHTPAPLPPVKFRYRRLCGPQDRSGRMRKTSPTPGFDPRTVQPVTSRCTDYANSATLNDNLDSRITASTIKDTENKHKYQPAGSTVP